MHNIIETITKLIFNFLDSQNLKKYGSTTYSLYSIISSVKQATYPVFRWSLFFSQQPPPLLWVACITLRKPVLSLCITNAKCFVSWWDPALHEM